MARPSKYNPAFCEKIVALGKLGKSKAQIASELGVVRNTLDNWAVDHPELSDFTQNMCYLSNLIRTHRI